MVERLDLVELWNVVEHREEDDGQDVDVPTADLDNQNTFDSLKVRKIYIFMYIYNFTSLICFFLMVLYHISPSSRIPDTMDHALIDNICILIKIKYLKDPVVK